MAWHSQLGTTGSLDVILDSTPSLADSWRIRASLDLDAGALERLAREASELDSA